LASAETDVATATERLEQAADRHQVAQEKTAAALERYETLMSTVGVAIQELQRRLDEVAEQMTERDRVEANTRTAESDARSRLGNAEGRRDAFASALANIEEERRSAIEGLRSFAATGLLRLACPEVDVPDPATEWAATPAIALARAIDRAL